MQEKTLLITRPYSFSARLQDYAQLTKISLSGLVVFSAVMGYIIATGTGFSWAAVFLLSIGGFLVTGSSNAFNQIIERDTDKLMDRTSDRPLPSGRMKLSEAYVAAIVMGVSGIYILWMGLNPLTGILSLFSLILYTAVYTPSKKITPFSVLIGAIPGAFPPLLGWVAAKNYIGDEAILLYAIQFIWQFPHFWAIAWVLNDDYQKGGFNMLPAGRSKSTAFQTMVYSACLIPLGIVPQMFGHTHYIATILMVLTAVFFTAKAFRLLSDCETKSAQKLMFGSFIYLPVVQIIWMINKLL